MTPGRIAGLYVLLDDDPRWPRDPISQAKTALAGGAAILQLRAKHADDQTQLLWAREIAALARTRGVPFLVNDRFDLALGSAADGVHLGQNDLAPEQIPEAARAKLIVGRSTHTLEQVRTARFEPVDYLAFGPIFDTTSKTSAYSARGTALLARACALSRPLPMVAIGGIGASRCGEVIHAGASGACVLSAVAAAADPVAATAALVAEVRAAESHLG